MLQIIQTFEDDQYTGGLFLKWWGDKSNPMMFPTSPSPPIKVINVTPELPQHHGLYASLQILWCRPWFTRACLRLMNTITLYGDVDIVPLHVILP